MDKKSRKRGGAKLSKPGAAFEQELGPLMNAIDEAVANMVDDRERQQVRQALGEAVHGALKQLSSPSRSVPARSSLTADALNSGVAALKQVQELGFVEFTTGLINGTFDALINATIKQMDAYAELVADLAKTLSQFQSENVDEGHITAHLSARYPDGAGGTTVRPDYTFQDTPADSANGIEAKAAEDKLLEVANALLAETKGNKTPLKFDGADALQAGQTAFTESQVNKARAAIGEMLAISMIEHLRAMAREGMARIVITNGELLSKLTFKVSTTDALAVQKAKLDQSSFGAGISGHFGGKRWGVQFGASYNSLSVSSVNESSFDAVTMNAEIIGMVKLQFKTESYPPVVVDNPIA